MTDIAINALAAYIKTKLPALNVIAGWPDPKDQLNMPCVSIIHAGEIGYVNLMTTLSEKIPDPDNEFNSLYIFQVGQYDYSIQIDLWCKHKIERKNWIRQIEDLFNEDFVDNGSGLNITLTEQYNAIASFDYVGYANMDSEDNIQRGYWRSKLNIVVTHARLIRKSLPMIIETSVIDGITETEIGE